ncbi:DUF1643 domain-containing protein [Clostridium arbusti]|uniref:DUF1643 domain-containing protein n=1 Tax=Clostridium arbusti TaxID=1137848 RepID=UPI000288EF94|nr:DUF1643 domain-containing protein [Clostridium arbusti]
MKKYPTFIIGTPFCKEKYLYGDTYLRFLLEVKYKESNNHNQVLCIMMNPSIANSNESDDTINKILKLLNEKMLFATLKVVNIYQVYKSQSDMLATTLEEIIYKLGKDEFNNIMKKKLSTIYEQIVKVDNIILAWGNPSEGMNEKKYLSRCSQITEFLSYLISKRLFVFKTGTWERILTQKGQPRHPSRNNLIDLVDCNIGIGNKICVKLK